MELTYFLCLYIAVVNTVGVERNSIHNGMAILFIYMTTFGCVALIFNKVSPYLKRFTSGREYIMH